MAVRLKDLANALGLSISTVSAVLRDRADFNSKTRQRVLAKAKELNYRPNWLARSLAMQKSHILGVVVPNLSRSFYPTVLEGIEPVVQNAGYHLVISNTGDTPAREDEEIATLLGRQVDGLIVASAHLPGKTGNEKLLAESGVPYLLIDRYFPGFPFVGNDNERVGFVATQHLIQQGYRAIAHLGRTIVATGVGRRRGYLQAMRKAGLRVRRNFVLETFGEQGGYETTQQLLQMRPRPDAIFAASDPVAIGALRALHEHGVEVSRDFGVIGVGRVRYGEDLRVPLSTVDIHSTEIGRAAATTLLSMIKGAPAPKNPIFIEPTLIARQSSRRGCTATEERTPGTR